MSNKALFAVLILGISSASIAIADESANEKKDESAATRALTDLKTRRLEEMNQLRSQLAKAKESLKASMIADEQDAFKAHKEQIAKLQRSISDTISAPISSAVINPLRMEVGQTGTLPSGRFKVSQILNKDKGEIIVASKYGPYIAFKLVGVDAKNLVDDADFKFLKTVVVAKTYTYESVSGAARTIFELHSLESNTLFTADELKPFNELATEKILIALTPTEKAKADDAKKQHAAQEEAAEKKKDEEQKKKDEETAKQQAEVKIKRSQSFLDLGKSLMKNDKAGGARKQFEKAISESPGSAPAKEAEELLKKLP